MRSHAFRPRICKTFSMLNSAQFEISTAHKKLNIPQMKKFIALSLSDVVFIMLINVKMPTIVGILTFMSRITIVNGRLLTFLCEQRPNTDCDFKCDYGCRAISTLYCNDEGEWNHPIHALFQITRLSLKFRIKNLQHLLLLLLLSSW